MGFVTTMMRIRFHRILTCGAIPLLFAGCGTTRMTDSPRTATEMLLVSQAADKAVAQIDFSALAGRSVFVDTAPVDRDVIDKGYLVSLIRQQLLADGATLLDDRAKADFIVELRSGGLGTDRHSLLVGTPAVSLPSVLPGVPTSIPEIALIKRNDQRGVAKVAVFAYCRTTGRAVWQSGTVEAMSRSKDLWVFGTGPFTQASIRKETELAGEPLPSIPDVFSGNHPPKLPDGTFVERYFPDYDVPIPPPQLPGKSGGPAIVPNALLGVTGPAAVGNRPVAR
jgi:hypothetical protein